MRRIVGRGNQLFALLALVHGICVTEFPTLVSADSLVCRNNQHLGLCASLHHCSEEISPSPLYLPAFGGGEEKIGFQTAAWFFVIHYYASDRKEGNYFFWKEGLCVCVRNYTYIFNCAHVQWEDA